MVESRRRRTHQCDIRVPVELTRTYTPVLEKCLSRPIRTECPRKDKLSKGRIGKEVILALYVVRPSYPRSTISMRVSCQIASSTRPTRKGRTVFLRDGQ